jgi:hypothetical protein
MVEPLRHRQTKGAETDMLDLTPPRHVSTLPTRAVAFAQIAALRHRAAPFGSLALNTTSGFDWVFVLCLMAPEGAP